VIPRAILLASFLPLSALAQLQVFEFNGTTDTPVGTVLIVSAPAPEDTVETRFHVRNNGSAPVVLQTLSVAGAGFTLQSAPSLGYILAPYTGLTSEAEIDIDFSPTIVTSYSATLVINTINMIIQGTVAPSAVVASAVLTLAGSTTPLGAGATVNFGSVDVGSVQTQGFVLSNSSTASINVATLVVSGAGFAGPIGLTAPVLLTPGQTAPFQVSFTPQSGAAAQGVLTVGQQMFNLTGQGVGSSPAAPQLQVFQIIGTTETPVLGTLVNVGTTGPGDTIETRFRVRNTGAGPAILQTISLAGDGFTILAAPSLPYTLSPYVGPASEAEIDIDFSPTIVASYSANFLINAMNFVLQGTALPSAVVTVGSSTTPLSAGATVNFGSVDVGQKQTETFVLSNSGTANINIATLAVSGADFVGPIGLSAPVQLAPGQTASFQVSFTPKSGPAAQGVLTVDTRTFNLTGQGLTAPPPSASLVFASTVGASAQQNSISIPLASASQWSGTGTLTLAFQSSVAGVTDDPAIEFLSGPPRIATITVSPGDTSAAIAGQSSMAFQTGTTAGTITFTLTLNNASQQTTLTIPHAPINLDEDTFSAVRLYGSLNVSFGGFDNTYSASQLAFTFYDLTGKVLPQGAIDVDAANAFKQYFSTTTAGGMFQVLAEFPVTGSSALIGYVTAQITNSEGASTALQIPFGN
jgi:hypothetical protein